MSKRNSRTKFLGLRPALAILAGIILMAGVAGNEAQARGGSGGHSSQGPSKSPPSPIVRDHRTQPIVRDHRSGAKSEGGGSHRR